MPALLGNWRSGSGPLATRLAQAIEEAAYRGELAKGWSLPSERSLADVLGLSRSTVVRAMEQLVEHGTVRRAQGAGTYIATPPQERVFAAIPPPLRAYYKHGATIAPSLAAAVFPTSDDLPPAALTLDSADFATLGNSASGYNIPGLPTTRQAVADLLTGSRFPTSPDSVILTTGATQALSMVFDLLLRSGDVVVVDAPTYPTTVDLLRRAGVQIIAAKNTTSGGVDTANLAHTALKMRATMAVVITTCNVATGATINAAARAPLVELAQKGVIVVDDLTLADYHRNEPPPHLGALQDHRNIISVGSFNKIYWGGLRAGWIRCHDSMMESLTWMKAKSDFGNSVPTQLILRKLLAHHAEITSTRRAQVRARAWQARTFLAEHLPDWTIEGTNQGPSLWVRLPVRDSAEFVAFAYKRNISTGYGGSYRSDGRGSPHIRLTLTADDHTFNTGLDQLHTAWVEFSPNRASPNRSAAPMLNRPKGTPAPPGNAVRRRRPH